MNPQRNDKSGVCELCNKHFDQLAIDAMKNSYNDMEETDQATIKGSVLLVMTCKCLVCQASSTGLCE